jgi:hypothetical protein
MGLVRNGLHMVDALIGAYPVHAGQLALQDMEANHCVQDAYMEAELQGMPWGESLKLFRQ